MFENNICKCSHSYWYHAKNIKKIVNVITKCRSIFKCWVAKTNSGLVLAFTGPSSPSLTHPSPSLTIPHHPSPSPKNISPIAPECEGPRLVYQRSIRRDADHFTPRKFSSISAILSSGKKCTHTSVLNLENIVMSFQRCS